MAHSPPSIPPDSGLPPFGGALLPREETLGVPFFNLDAISRLRQSLSTTTESPASILHATTDVARLLTGADGVAIAVRTKGVVVCRARSGEIAPDLGALVNVDSGISGECLRTESILVCNDAAIDDRVDPDVCRVLGIRSIVVVPLRGPAGVAGILEAFSVNPSAFGNEHIHSLRELAEIAEAAHEREFLAWDTASVEVKPATQRQIIHPEPQPDELPVQSVIEPSPRRRYWIAGAAFTALLSISGVLWLSWRDPTPEVAASELSAEPMKTMGRSASASLSPGPPKPGAGITNRKVTPEKAADVLRKAAEIQPVGADSRTQDSSSIDTTSEVKSAPKESDSGNEAPPPVEIAASSTPDLFSGTKSSGAVLPTLDVKVSKGITEAVLVHQVLPVYPVQARTQRVAGSVVMDAMIGADGNVRDIMLISGPPLLAEASMSAVRQWRYTPAALNGAAIEVQKRITMVFTLP